jgi:hypothetical protein
MELRVIKLPTGYLNMDADAMTFTRSGNWGEAAKVKERKAAVTFAAAMRVIVGVLLMGIALVALVIKNEHRGGGELMPLVAIGMGFFSFVVLFRKLNDGFLSSYKIPYSKVSSMRYEDGRAVIVFTNAAWKLDRTNVQVSSEEFAFLSAMFERSRST